MKTISNNLYMLKITWQASKVRIIVDFVISAMNQFKSYFMSLIFIQVIVSYIEGDTKNSFSFILTFIIITCIFLMISELANIWYNNRFIPLSNCVLYKNINTALFTKASDVDLQCYENASFYNMYMLAANEADSRISAVLSNISSMLFTFIALVAIYYTMFSIDPFVILLSIFPLFSSFVVRKKINNNAYRITKEQAPYKRKLNYSDRIFKLRDFAEELRLTNIRNVVYKNFKESIEELLGVYKKYRIIQFLLGLINMQLTFTFLYEGTVLYCAYMVLVSKSMTIGQFAVLAVAMRTAVWTLFSLTSNINEIIKNGLFIENFKTFMNYTPKISESQKGVTVPSDFTCLEFKKVSFKYNEDKDVLKDISLKINNGDKIAIVGYNGAGKTTFTKLLTRLYDPMDGDIFYNDINIKNITLKEYREVFSTVCQDFKIFSMSIKENILLDKNNDELLKNAISAGGLTEKIKTLEKGINSTMTREFDDKGVVMSGGETQKLAVCRAYAKDFKIAVFDEPSSALDPVSEYNLFSEMLSICKDKTLIFISHRLSSTVLADKIYVFNNGKIEEEGSHSELIGNKGIYYDMFKSQAEKYIKETEVYHE